MQLDARQTVKLFFAGMSAAGIVLANIPILKQQFVDYGPRLLRASAQAHDTTPSILFHNKVARRVARLISAGVPHSWFVHFYIISVASSIVWGLAIANTAPIFRLLKNHVIVSGQCSQDTMSVGQVWLAWSLMAFQGIRRLAESIFVTNPGNSTMPLSIYATGILYYLFVNVAVWVEGQECIVTSTSTHPSFETLSTKQIVFIAIFFLASAAQFDCHSHLASLKKYTLPDRFMFRYILAPHYTMECLIYLSLSLIAAPQSATANKTLLLVVGFVTVNLGVVAGSTRVWSEEKFGKEQVSKRWRMIPLVW